MSDAPKVKAWQDGPLTDGLAHIVWKPVSTRRAFQLLTRLHFSNNAHFGQWKERMGEFVWTKEENTKLFIDLDFNYDPRSLDRAPAIYVGTDKFSYTQSVVGDVKGVSEDRAGTEYYSAGSTTVIIRHVGKTADEAFALAELSDTFYRGIKKMMLEKAKLTRYFVRDILSSQPFGPASPEEADKLFKVDLIIEIGFNDVWLSVQESHLVKTISFKHCLAEFSDADSMPPT